MTGYDAAFAAGYDIAVKIDGDGQMDPAYVQDLVQPILAGKRTTRRANRFYQREHAARMPAVRVFGNSVLSFMTKVSTGYWNVMDPTNGFTAIHAVAAREVDMAKVDRRYFFESDILFRLSIARAVVMDVPMPAIYGLETSNLSNGSVLLEFPFKHARNLFKRFAYNYLIREFSVGTVQFLAGLALTVFGVGLEPSAGSGTPRLTRTRRRDRDPGDAADHPRISAAARGPELRHRQRAHPAHPEDIAADAVVGTGSSCKRQTANPRLLQEAYRKTKNFDAGN
jgi:hypothetical protein